jgi:hypothetical protein
MGKRNDKKRLPIVHTEIEKAEAKVKRETASLKYKPNPIKFLLVAEAPPLDLTRYFYFEDMTVRDGFYLETMNALYGTSRFDPKFLRKNKENYLNCFKRDGFYLIDACEDPMESDGKSNKEKEITEHLPNLKRKLSGLICSETTIVLILATVYRVCFDELRKDGFRVINKCTIPFPGNGHQNIYRENLTKLLQDYGWRKVNCI